MHQVSKLGRALVLFLWAAAAVLPVAPAAAAAAGVPGEETLEDTDPYWAPGGQLSFQAHVLALGRANAGTVGGLPAVTTNPAGLAGMRRGEWQVGRLNPASEMVLESVAVGIPGPHLSWAFALQQLTSPGIIRRDEEGRPTGFFTYSEGSLSLAAAKRQAQLDLGVTAATIWQRAGAEAKRGMKLIAGAQWPVSPYCRLGLAMKWVRHDGAIFSKAMATGGLVWHKEPFSWYFGITDGESSLGVEWRLLPHIALRFGALEVGGQVVPAGGLAVSGMCVTIEYAYSGHSIGQGSDEHPQQLALGHVLNVRFKY
ncbi:MAG TPA: hypothetical protein GXX29_04330 [Firmicutes bacterium]|nr:hypothetical protein [Bacillota bacterium]